MLRILAFYGIPKQVVDAVGKMYENTKARVVSPDGETDLFDILADVVQRDTLAPTYMLLSLTMRSEKP